jgi:hypothetical protein
MYFGRKAEVLQTNLLPSYSGYPKDGAGVFLYDVTTYQLKYHSITSRIIVTPRILHLITVLLCVKLIRPEMCGHLVGQQY